MIWPGDRAFLGQTFLEKYLRVAWRSCVALWYKTFGPSFSTLISSMIRKDDLFVGLEVDGLKNLNLPRERRIGCLELLVEVPIIPTNNSV